MYIYVYYNISYLFIFCNRLLFIILRGVNCRRLFSSCDFLVNFNYRWDDSYYL